MSSLVQRKRDDNSTSTSTRCSIEKSQILSLGNVCMIDGSWTDCKDQIAMIWLQGFDCNDKRASSLVELCNKIRDDKDYDDMFLEFQDLSYSKSAK